MAAARAPCPAFLVELAKNAPAMMWTFTATTFLSALLLFAIQPMFAKMVLPVLGGSPSVWSVSVFFFQAALLAGYLYAHLLINKAPPHLTGIIHLVVCLLAFVCLPIGMVTWLGEPPQGEPYLWQLGMFAASIGLPFMAVSANAPLLQAWFARSGHPDARDPYFMYAASNLGSLIALLGYPFILEPAFGLSQLSHLWAWAYGLLVLAIGASFFLMRGAQAGGVPETAAAPAGDDVAAAAPTLVNRLELDRAGVRPGRAGDGVHGAHHHRRGLGAAAVGDPAGALPAHLRAGVPRPAADLARGPAVPAPRRPGDRAHRPVVPDPRLVHPQRHRRCGVLHHGDAGAPHALRGAAGAALPHRVLPLDVVRRRAGRHVHGAGGAQALQRGLRVSAAAGASRWRAGPAR